MHQILSPTPVAANAVRYETARIEGLLSVVRHCLGTLFESMAPVTQTVVLSNGGTNKAHSRVRKSSAGFKLLICAEGTLGIVIEGESLRSKGGFALSQPIDL